MTSIPSPEQHRADYIAGLRLLADVLERSPELPLPYEGDASNMTFHFLSGGDPKAEMAAAVRAIPCSFTKHIHGAGDMYFDLQGRLHGLKVNLVAYRAKVCERVVIATREELVEEPDPDALAAVPMVTKTVAVEDVEWRCHPILSATEAKVEASA